jgi:hypothetical protein
MADQGNTARSILDLDRSHALTSEYHHKHTGLKIGVFLAVFAK